MKSNYIELLLNDPLKRNPYLTRARKYLKLSQNIGLKDGLDKQYFF